jgi:hypothetical protein
MKIMTASELTAHALSEAIWEATGRAHYVEGIELVLTVSSKILARAILLAWAMSKDLRVEVDESYGYRWTVLGRRILPNGRTEETLVYNDGC